MSLKYLLDANVLSEPLKSKPNRLLLKRLTANEGSIATSTTVWYELLFGAEICPGKARRATIRAYLEELESSPLRILDYTVKAVEWQAGEAARLRKNGITRPFRDMQIAAVAKVNGLVLVTDNESDFADIRGLQIRNWMKR